MVFVVGQARIVPPAIDFEAPRGTKNRLVIEAFSVPDSGIQYTLAQKKSSAHPKAADSCLGVAANHNLCMLITICRFAGRCKGLPSLAL